MYYRFIDTKKLKKYSYCPLKPSISGMSISGEVCDVNALVRKMPAFFLDGRHHAPKPCNHVESSAWEIMKTGPFRGPVC